MFGKGSRRSRDELPAASRSPSYCPGAFPTDLEATDCRYTGSQRVLDFVSGTVTDQAVLGAVVFGLGAQVIQSPSEWKRTWDGYGMTRWFAIYAERRQRHGGVSIRPDIERRPALPCLSQ